MKNFDWSDGYDVQIDKGEPTLFYHGNEILRLSVKYPLDYYLDPIDLFHGIIQHLEKNEFSTVGSRANKKANEAITIICPSGDPSFDMMGVLTQMAHNEIMDEVAMFNKFREEHYGKVQG